MWMGWKMGNGEREGHLPKIEICRLRTPSLGTYRRQGRKANAPSLRIPIVKTYRQQQAVKQIARHGWGGD
jgi:hypothetical protein